MTTVNYPSPVTVNGYSCKNCTDVDNAKRNIDPSHPKDGPFGVNRQDKPGQAGKAFGSNFSAQAVVFGGQLSHLSQADKAPVSATATPNATQGHRLDLSV
jgi:hypothetical protein